MKSMNHVYFSDVSKIKFCLISNANDNNNYERTLTVKNIIPNDLVSNSIVLKNENNEVLYLITGNYIPDSNEFFIDHREKDDVYLDPSKSNQIHFCIARIIDMKLRKPYPFHPSEISYDILLDLGNGITQNTVLLDSLKNVDFRNKKIVIISNIKPECIWDDMLYVLCFKNNNANVPFFVDEKFEEGTSFMISKL